MKSNQIEPIIINSVIFGLIGLGFDLKLYYFIIF